MLICRPATDGCDSITKFVRELNSKMAQAADSLHRDQIAWKRSAMAQRIVGCDARTQERRCFHGAQSIRQPYNRLGRRDHVLLITTVVTNTRNLEILAIPEISAAA